METHTLDPADQILNLCVHGIAWNPVPPLRWIPDVIMVMNSSQSQIDWKRLADQAQKRQLVSPVSAALHYLTAQWSAPIPTSALDTFDNLPNSIMDRLDHKSTTRNRSKHVLGDLPHHLCHYFRLTKDVRFPNKIIGLPKYFKYVWKVDNLRQLILQAAIKAKRRLGIYLQ